MAHDMARGFVLLSEAVPGIVQDIRYASSYNFIGERIVGYDEAVAIVTREAASALAKVSAAVARMGLAIKVFDAYRPQRAVDRFAAWVSDPGDTRMKSIFYPNIDKAELIMADYISLRSSHSRGSAVDLTLVDASTRAELDMGSAFDCFDETSWSDSALITESQQRDRDLLRSVMLDSGFKPIKSEWWHYTLADEPYPDTYFDFPVSASSIVLSSEGASR